MIRNRLVGVLTFELSHVRAGWGSFRSCLLGVLEMRSKTCTRDKYRMQRIKFERVTKISMIEIRGEETPNRC